MTEPTTQPEALALADALDNEFVSGRISNHTGRKAASELRNRHAVIERLNTGWQSSNMLLLERSSQVSSLNAERDTLSAEVERLKEHNERLISGYHELNIAYQHLSTTRDTLAADNARLRAELASILHQIDIGDFTDGHGHSAKMLSAVLDAKNTKGVNHG